MNDVIQWGLGIVQWVQTFRNPLLDQFFLTINFLGDEDFYLLFLPVLFWCLDKRAAIRLGLIFLFSLYVNQSLKDFFAAPRPYEVSAQLYAPIRQPGYGIPSAHAQGTATVWGYLAARLNTRFLWALALAIPPLVSLGRVYLGDHFPQDVLAGLMLGVVLAAAFAVLEPRLAGRVIALSPRTRVGLVVVAALVSAMLHLTMDTAVLIGTFLGFYSSAIVEEESLCFDSRAVWWKQLLKLAVGLAVVFGLRLGLKAMFPAIEVFNLLRYAIIGVWIGIGAPWVFVRMGLAPRVLHGSAPKAPSGLAMAPDHAN